LTHSKLEIHIMRAVFGIVSLLLALFIVGTLVKKQMAVQVLPAPASQTPSSSAMSNPASTQREQAQQIQQQIKQTLEMQTQTPRPIPE
jgi:hypothetical protein